MQNNRNKCFSYLFWLDDGRIWSRSHRCNKTDPDADPYPDHQHCAQESNSDLNVITVIVHFVWDKICFRILQSARNRLAEIFDHGLQLIHDRIQTTWRKLAFQ